MAEWSFIRKLSAEAYGYLERARRDDGSRYVRRKNGSPEWVADLCREAHGNSLPDNWIYEQIANCLASILDNDCEDDALEDAESAIDVYSSDLLDWANGRAEYVDDAIRDGAQDLSSAIMMGQQAMIGEIFYAIVSFLTGMAEDLEEEAADFQRKYELENPRDDMPPEAYDPEEDSDLAESQRGLR